MAKRATKKAAPKKSAAKRELIAPRGAKRYIRRDVVGRIKESDDVSRSLSQDRRTKAKTAAKPGQGDRGDLIHIATTEPRSYVGLLGRVLPLDVNARVMRDETSVCRGTKELLAELRNRGIPVDQLLTTVELRPLRSVGDDDEDR